MLLKFAGAVGNDYVVDLRSVAELLGEFLYCGIYEVLIEFFLHKVDGAAAEAAACGMDAIGSDELGRAKINYDKCVSIAFPL